MTTYYADAAGRYLGGFEKRSPKGVEVKHPNVPRGALEVPGPPADVRMVWDGNTWLTTPELDAEAKLEYRRARAREYAHDLGAEPGFENAVGDVLDALIDAVEAGDHTRLTAIKAKRDAIKARHPKPV